MLHSLSLSLVLGLLSHYFFIESISVRVLCIVKQEKEFIRKITGRNNRCTGKSSSGAPMSLLEFE